MFDQPFVRDSFIQQIDPRMRVLLAVLLAVALALLRQMTACCLGLGLGCVLLGLAQAPLGPLWRRLVAINMFILFLWLVTPWTTPGAVVWQWHFIQVSREGVYLSLLVTLKSNAIACVFLALVASLPAATLGHALERLGCPDKLVFLFLFTGRYIHLLAGEWQGSGRVRICIRTEQSPPCWGCCWCAAMTVPSVRTRLCVCVVFLDVFIRWIAFACARWMCILHWPRYAVWPVSCGLRREESSCEPVGER